MNTLSLQRQFMTSSSSNTPFKPMKPIPKTAKVFLNSTDKMMGTNSEATFKINLPTEFTTQNLGLTMTNFIPVYPTGTIDGIVQVNMVGVENPHSYSSSNRTTHRSLGMFELQGEGKGKEYPPAALTDFPTTTLSNLQYGNGAYTLDAVNWVQPRSAFTKVPVLFTQTANNTYNATTGVYIGATSITATNGSNYAGTQLKLTMPNAIRLTSYSVEAVWEGALGKTTSSWVLLGSSNNSNWDVLHHQAQSNLTANQVVETPVSNSNLYNGFMFVPLIAGNSTFSTGRDYAMITELRFFSQTKPQTGYTTTTITQSNSTVPAWNTFSASVDAVSWDTGSIYDASTGVYQGSNFTTVDGSNMTGEWMEIQAPEQVILRRYSMLGDASLRTHPSTFTMAASSNGTNYTRIHTQCNINVDYVDVDSSNLPTSASYNRYRLLVHKVGNDGMSGRTNAVVRWMDFSGYSNINGIGNQNELFNVPPVGMTSNVNVITGRTAGNGMYEISSSFTNSNLFIFNNYYDDIWSPHVYANTTGLYTGSNTTSIGSSNINGEWVQINTPCPMMVSELIINSSDYPTAAECPSAISFVGANVGSDFNLIFTMCNLTNWGEGPNFWQRIIKYGSSNSYTFDQTAFPTNPYKNWRLIIHRVGNEGLSNARTRFNLNEIQLRGWASNVPYPFPPPMTAPTTTISYVQIGNGTYTVSSSSNIIPITTSNIFPLVRTGQSNLNAEIITTDRSLFQRPVTLRLSSPTGMDLTTMCNWSAELTVRELP
jgi:hypothetical protein